MKPNSPGPSQSVGEELAKNEKSATVQLDSSPSESLIKTKIAEHTSSKPFPIVGIGASAGGYDAVSAFLRALPAETGMAFVLVQHMDPKHESMLNKLLARETQLPVTQVTDRMEMAPNHVYVIPPNREMTIENGVLRLMARPRGILGYTPIDRFLTSLAQNQQERAIGIILSGIGSDGTRGLKAIKAEGGITFAQEEGTAKFAGMPSSAITADCVDFILPPAEITKELSRAVGHPYLRAMEPLPLECLPAEKEEGNLRKIFRLLRASANVDFSLYKLSTIRRRIARRMILVQSHDLSQYVKFMEQHTEEPEALFRDILIHVTFFFREPESFRTLTKKVLPKLLENANPGEPIRIWVPGCSSGEEVYSIAIDLLEFLGKRVNAVPIQIFGTDISMEDVQKSRAGFYPASAMVGVSPERLERFFVKANGGYQIVNPVRDLCVFSRHDLGKDPPFPRLNLISCQNVLIYFGPALQKRVLALFHYALKPQGFLWLGKSETLSAYANLFNLEENKAKIYSRKRSSAQPLMELTGVSFEKHSDSPTKKAETNAETPLAFDLRKEGERIVLEKYAPAGFTVDADLQILHFLGDTSQYLKPIPGEPSLNLGKMARRELFWEIRKGVQKAKNGMTVRQEDVQFKQNGGNAAVDIDIVPIQGRLPNTPDFLVLIQEARPEKRSAVKPAGSKKAVNREAGETARLRRELESTREHLGSMIEDHEASAEELRAANEEILSSNEELQSTNEEIETAKEELQSGNEELTTLNEELQNRNAELSQSASDLTNLLAATEIPIVMLGNDQRIRRFTPAAEKILNLISADVGRPISQIKHNVDIPDFEKLLSQVLDGNRYFEREVQDQEGRWYSLRIRPYLTKDYKIQGAVMALMDIDAIKRASVAVVETLLESLIVLDSDFRVISANPAFYETFQLKPGEVEGQVLLELGNGQWNIPCLRQLLGELLPGKKAILNFELDHTFPVLGVRHLLLNARQIYEEGVGKQMILVALEDTTEHNRARANLQSLTADLFFKEEEIRKSIARELHDGCGQKLAAIGLRLSALQKKIPSASRSVHKEMRSLSGQVGGVTEQLSEFTRGLHPAVLEELGLIKALRVECETFSRQSKIPVRFWDWSVPRELPPKVALSFYRIVQEGLRNVMQHAGAKKVEVGLMGSPASLLLRIEDDGYGMDSHRLRQLPKGLGLISMDERARSIGGHFSITSEPNKGTKIEVQVALQEAHHEAPANTAG